MQGGGAETPNAIPLPPPPSNQPGVQVPFGPPPPLAQAVSITVTVQVPLAFS